MTPTKRKVSFTFKREISLYNQERIYRLVFQKMVSEIRMPGCLGLQRK
jgi:hypothetical protein